MHFIRLRVKKVSTTN